MTWAKGIGNEDGITVQVDVSDKSMALLKAVAQMANNVAEALVSDLVLTEDEREHYRREIFMRIMSRFLDDMKVNINIERGNRQ